MGESMELQESFLSDNSMPVLSCEAKRHKVGQEVHAPEFPHKPISALSNLIHDARASWYTPQQYFVAWSGVLTIVYDGIPPAIEELKARMDDVFKCLAKENPGSKWPKTSLACLKDGRRLSLPQLQRLTDICREESGALAETVPMLVDRLTVAVYDTCCLERLLSRDDVALSQPADGRKPTEAQRAHVRSVTDDMNHVDRYWFDASRDGNRSTHYRSPRLGVSLVHFLAQKVPPSLERFRKRVDEALPDMYDWFPDHSLHITVRGLT